MTPSITLIGMGEDGFDGLSSAARSMIEAADVIVGSTRLLAMLPPTRAERVSWPSPFDPMTERIEGWSDRRVVILATGDPMNYGVGSLIAPRFKSGMKIIPAPSAFSLAAARMGWSLADVEMLSLHGRDASLLAQFIAPDLRIIALTEGDTTVRAAAEMLSSRHFGQSEMTVLEHMGGVHEKVATFSASAVPAERFADLTTLAIACVAEDHAAALPRTPGLPDSAYQHDGQITKREVRAATVAALMPMPGAMLWDIGAGCGSVSIEWMRAARNAKALAIEPNATRRQHIGDNAQRLGTPGIALVAGPAPDALNGLPAPAAIFHGGAVSNAEIFEAAWKALGRGGRFVANAVTLDAEAALYQRHAKFGGELVRIGIAHASPVGSKRTMQPRLTVTQWRAIKP